MPGLVLSSCLCIIYFTVLEAEKSLMKVWQRWILARALSTSSRVLGKGREREGEREKERERKRERRER